jgi:hypothetical protein
VTEQEKQEFVAACRDDVCFFGEHVLRDEDLEHYIYEDYQKQALRCPARSKLYFWARRLSKSLLILHEFLHRATFNRGYISMTVSPAWSQSLDLGERLLTIVDSTDEIGSLLSGKKKTQLTFKNNSRMHFVSAGREGRSQLGRGVHGLAFDECQQIIEDTFVFLRPTLLGQKKGKQVSLIMAGTPLGRIGTFYDTYCKGKYYITMDGVFENTELLPEDADSNWIIFQRPTAILNNKNEIIGTGTDRITVAELKQEQREMPMTGFLREFALQWLDSIGEVFPKSLLERVTDHDAEPVYSSDKEIIFGLDVGKQRHNSVLTVMETVKNKMRVIYVEAFPLETDYHDVIEKVLNMSNRYPNTLELMIDETGVGSGVVEIAERRAAKIWRNLRVEGFNFAGPRKKQSLIENAVAELESGRFSMYFNQRQQDEMLEFKRTVTDKNNIIYQKPAGGSDDYVDSLALALWAAKEYRDYEDPEPDVYDTGIQLLGEAQRNIRRVMRNYR